MDPLHSTNHTQIITHSIITSLPSGLISPENFINLRENYEAIIELDNAKERLIEIAKEISKYVANNQPSLIHLENLEIYTIPFAGEPIFTEFSSEKNIITIGRKSWCDIKIGTIEQVNVSRLHTVIIKLDDGRILVIDVGTGIGINTVYRSTGKECRDSTAKSREILTFDRGETFRLRLGISSIVVSPKMCIICCEIPRTIRFNCGHLLCCERDALKVIQEFQTCPYCRRIISYYEKDLPLKSYATGGDPL